MMDSVSHRMSFDELVESLREIEGLRDKGKRHPNFHLRSKPFLHFHSGPDGTYADVRFDADFESVAASTPEEREALLKRVREHVSVHLGARRQAG